MENPEEVEIRRAPKVLPWGLTGAVFGMIVALLLSVVAPESESSSYNVLGLLLVSLGSLGLGAGIALAILVDLVTASKAKRASAIRAERDPE
jgi:MFS-type transporter involved in bile tolerance (Atg22 family)